VTNKQPARKPAAKRAPAKKQTATPESVRARNVAAAKRAEKSSAPAKRVSQAQAKKLAAAEARGESVAKKANGNGKATSTTKAPANGRTLTKEQTLVLATIRDAKGDVARKQLREAGVTKPTGATRVLIRRGLVEGVDVHGKHRTFKLTAAGRAAVAK
jgi:hypothetical protein